MARIKVTQEDLKSAQAKGPGAASTAPMVWALSYLSSNPDTDYIILGENPSPQIIPVTLPSGERLVGFMMGGEMYCRLSESGSAVLKAAKVEPYDA